MDEYETILKDRLRDAAYAPGHVDAEWLWRRGRVRRRRRFVGQSMGGVLLLIAAGAIAWQVGLGDGDEARDEPVGGQSCLTQPTPGPAGPHVIYMVCDDTEVTAVSRTTAPEIPADAVQALVAGPSQSEQDRGFSSPFVGLTVNVSTVDDGLYVDFQGDPTLVREAGALAQMALTHTVFGFETIRTLTVALNGSCEGWTEATGSPCNTEAPGRTPPPEAPTECRGEPGDPAACTESPNPN